MGIFHKGRSALGGFLYKRHETMIVRIIDRSDNQINMGNIEAIRQENDNLVTMIPKQETTIIHINGSTILQSERPSFDISAIKSMEVLP